MQETNLSSAGLVNEDDTSLVLSDELLEDEDFELSSTTFSACLLVRDDNDLIPEWLSYHYHALNLRQLIVAVDPLSSESPSDILAKWRLMTNLDIAEWTDSDFMPQRFLNTGRAHEKFMPKKEDYPDPQARLEVGNHRYRQRVFLAQCMKRLRDKGHSWMMHIDTDEYIVPSKLTRQMKPDYLKIPSMREPNSVLRVLQQIVKQTPILVHYPCLSMMRVLFGSLESTTEELAEDTSSVQEHFNVRSFETLTFRHHADPRNMTQNGNPKVLLDLSAIPKEEFDDVVFSIHRPIRKFCHVSSNLDYSRFRRQPIAVNHYVGSWERYGRKSDKRRDRQKYDIKASVNKGVDDGIRPWLQGFVDTMGLSSAKTLLGRSHWDDPDGPLIANDPDSDLM